MNFPNVSTPQAASAPPQLPRVAVVGSGISGLAVAHTLAGCAQVTLFEAGDYFGGHTHTVDVRLPNAAGELVTHGVDTGFLVFNERTYPNLIALFAQLGVETAASDMSFSVKVPDTDLEWSGSSLNTVFAQRRNLWRPGFWRMLKDVVRFNRLATAIAVGGDTVAAQEPLSVFLQRHGFCEEFKSWYFLPMIGCIWSCPTDQMLQFPVLTMARFCHNHGLIQITNRPQWHTVRGGARNYVEKILAGIADKRLNTPVQWISRDATAAKNGVAIGTHGQVEHFDKVVLATHSDQALSILREPLDAERAVLGAIRYQPNVAVLHTDTRVLPTRRSAWAAWNYERASSVATEHSRVCLHYWINQLQPLPFAQDVVVSLNPTTAIDPALVLGTYHYDHPVFDAPAIAAQGQLPQLQGQAHTYFCGAWAGYGFHEDGLKSGLQVGRHILTGTPSAGANAYGAAP